jgi:hypothetical protein
VHRETSASENCQSRSGVAAILKLRSMREPGWSEELCTMRDRGSLSIEHITHLRSLFVPLGGTLKGRPRLNQRSLAKMTADKLQTGRRTYGTLTARL